MTKLFMSEVRALRDPDLRNVAVKLLSWRLLYIPAAIWAMPFAVLVFIVEFVQLLIELLRMPMEWMKPFFCRPGWRIAGRRKKLYAEGAKITRAREAEQAWRQTAKMNRTLKLKPTCRRPKDSTLT